MLHLDLKDLQGTKACKESHCSIEENTLIFYVENLFKLFILCNFLLISCA